MRRRAGEPRGLPSGKEMKMQLSEYGRLDAGRQRTGFMEVEKNDF
jgi:hypothetical protein